MKLCVDCKNYRGGGSTAKCHHEEHLSLVDGRPTIFCSSMRSKLFPCGPDALLFEPQPPKPPKETRMQFLTRIWNKP